MGANVKQSDPWSLLCHSLREQQDCHVHFFWLRVDLTVPLSVCVSPCVCAKNWRSILSLINIQILQLRGGEQLRKTSTCVIAKGSKKDRLHIVLRWRQLENQRLRRYVDSIERLEIFSFAWMHAMLMWHAQHELWSRSWPMKSEHLGKPTKEIPRRDRWRALLETTSWNRCWDWCEHAHKHVDLAPISRSMDGVM